MKALYVATLLVAVAVAAGMKRDRWKTAPAAAIVSRALPGGAPPPDFFVQEAFRDPKTDEWVLFGQLKLCKPVGCRAAIARQLGKTWRVFELDEHDTWETVRTTPDQNVYLGVLESQVEAPSNELPFVV